MGSLFFLAGLALFFTAAGLAAVQAGRTRRLLRRLDGMLERAIRGEFRAEDYDESTLSRLEAKLEKYLDISSISAKNVRAEHDRMKELISDISHQTKTPIANLLLYSELLSDADLPEEQAGNVAAIHGQAEKLRFLIDSLVKLSRLENGILSLTPVRTDVGAVLRAAADPYREKAEAKGLSLTVPDIEVFARIDAKWTTEAIANLVDNAVKYTDAGGVEISVQEYELFVRVDIRDTGIGIPEPEQTRIFDRFYRSPSVAASEGVGIGLFLARQILSGEGGYLKLRSEVGKGSTFSVFLPR